MQINIEKLQQYERCLKTLRDQVKIQTTEESTAAKEQIEFKLTELKSVLKKIHAESLKEDKFSTIMNTIISNL